MSARVRAARLRALLLTLVTFFVVAATATGCASGGDERPRVVVTTNILGDITREIVGDEADVSVLMKPNADPHSFGLSAVQAAELEDADLVVHNGLGLEENVLRHVEAARASGVATFAAGEAADPLTFHAGGEGGPDGGTGTPDPHFWTDPDRVRKAAGLIADQVVEHVDGVNEKAVRDNAESYDGQLADLTAWMEKSFAAVPEDRRALVTNHHVFGYLADRFGFRVIGAVIPSGTTLASPSSSDLRSLTQAMEKANVRTVFADSSQPTRLAEVLRQEMGGDVDVVPLYSESLTEKGKGAGTYLEMMRANTSAMAEGLTGD
ncbi:zinc ABC transporter substrate-binding protein AztC [Streptomyces tendae]|uniref:Zinc ABC transporter substrate-binding protein AztC n=1 Tax=Streptomyces tendae TaxID=1932 RepID=A0ABW7S7L9_STRTE|nr:zinc ABC transporter substrate-binding protein AztC [Streptomyces sp. SID5914]MZG17791.1 zinc ABC transporter solute-binding protein [Streptomyces sp. SID5914]BET46645.1 zinc ABC transporter substrate-binding protein AztC [Kitasatospora aureofaciens]